MLALIDQVDELDRKLTQSDQQAKEAHESATRLKDQLQGISIKYEEKIQSIHDQVQDKDKLLEQTLADYNDQTDKMNEIRDDIEQAEEAIRVYRDRISQLEEENDAYVQRYEQQESIMEDLK